MDLKDRHQKRQSFAIGYGNDAASFWTKSLEWRYQEPM